MKITVDTHPEFGIELVLSVPYAYWLHKNNQLEKVITSKDMKPFYYFCDNIEERYTQRTIDNTAAGLNSLPNDWLHHNAMAMFGEGYGEISEEKQFKANGVLDYSKWTPPPLKEKYKNDRFKFDKELVIINNSYNIEGGGMPTRYFSIECLYYIFNYLTEKNYQVIYHRPKNNTLPTQDQNELNSIQLGEIESEVKGIGLVNDHELVNYYDNVILFDDLVNENQDLSFNKIQCMLYSNCNKFISYIGGAGILTSYFEGTSVMWLSRGGESRKDYFSKNSYYRNLSNNNLIICKDVQKTYPHSIENYQEFIQTIKKTF